MRFFHFFILFIIVNSCLKNIREINYDPSQASVIVNEIQKKLISQLKIEKDLYPWEFGGGAKNPIRLIHCGFVYYNDIDIATARKLIILVVNKFVNEINTNEKIRPFLEVYPFKPENMEIRIFLKNSNGSELSAEKLHVISIINGKLKYKTGIPSSEGLPLTTIYQETYEEAMAKISNASEKISL